MTPSGGPSFSQGNNLRSAFDLEHAHGGALADHVVGGGGGVRQVLQLEAVAEVLATQIE